MKMLLVAMERWFLKPPKTHVMPGAGAFAGIGGELETDIVRPVEEIKIAKRGLGIRQVEDERGELAEAVFER